MQNIPKQNHKIGKKYWIISIDWLMILNFKVFTHICLPSFLYIWYHFWRNTGLCLSLAHYRLQECGINLLQKVEQSSAHTDWSYLSHWLYVWEMLKTKISEIHTAILKSHSHDWNSMHYVIFMITLLPLFFCLPLLVQQRNLL